MRSGKKGLWRRLLLFLSFILLLSGCGKGSGGGEREALDFTVASEAAIPPELGSIIEEKKQAEFKLTYSDGDSLYLAVGLGRKETGGYSMSVKALYLQDGTICLETSSSGPEKDEEAIPAPSCPYLVVKLPYREEPVVFL